MPYHVTAGLAQGFCQFLEVEGLLANAQVVVQQDPRRRLDGQDNRLQNGAEKHADGRVRPGNQGTSACPEPRQIMITEDSHGQSEQKSLAEVAAHQFARATHRRRNRP